MFNIGEAPFPSLAERTNQPKYLRCELEPRAVRLRHYHVQANATNLPDPQYPKYAAVRRRTNFGWRATFEEGALPA